MLGDALRRPVGVGDVRMRPESRGVWQELRMEFFGDARADGGRHHAVVFAWAPAFAAFLRDTYELVPPGSEEVSVDDFLANVIAGG
jgi:hypothetical protein